MRMAAGLGDDVGEDSGEAESDQTAYPKSRRALLPAASGLPGVSGAQDSSPQLGGGSRQVQRPEGSTGGRGGGSTGRTPDPD